MTRIYRVKWEIDIFTESNPKDAAREALKIQRDPYSNATVFDVEDNESKKVTRVDLE